MRLCTTLLQNFFFPPTSNLQKLPDSLTLGETEIDEDLMEDNVRKIQIETNPLQQNKQINSVH